MPFIPPWLWKVILGNLGLEIPDIVKEAIKKIPEQDDAPPQRVEDEDPYLAECAYDRACEDAERLDVRIRHREERDADDYWE